MVRLGGGEGYGMEESEGVPLVRVRHQRNASCIIHELRITRLVIGGLGRVVDATESVVLSLSLLVILIITLWLVGIELMKCLFSFMLLFFNSFINLRIRLRT